MADLGIVVNGTLLVEGGRIVAVGPQRQVERMWKKLPPKERKATREIDAGGRVALPGFVDSHTHLIHAASRANEYEMRIAGASYEQIAAAGGGIASSVAKMRVAKPIDLKKRALTNLQLMAGHGTTTIEAKSGYGLNLQSELRTLRLHQELGKGQPLEIVSTFLGAHVPPPEYHSKPGEYVELLIHKMIPLVASEGLAEYCDVFCDVGAFSLEQSRRILTAARACGMKLRVHAEQLTRTGSAQLAVQLHAASCDHLEQINADEIRALASSDTVATLLPGCCFHLGLLHYAPARGLVDAGAIVALATDFNPGTSPTLSMSMVLSLACTQMRLTPAEAIAAATINAAYSLGRAHRIGSLEVGKQADIAIFDLDDYREIPYYFGVNHCWRTIKRGKTIWKRA